MLKGDSDSAKESVCTAANTRRHRRDSVAVRAASVAGRKDRMWPSAALPSRLSLSPPARTVLDPVSIAVNSWQ